jgi:hypothetical protein
MPDAHTREMALSKLRALIRREHCVLSYDLDLIEALPEILREQHGIAADRDIEGHADVRALFELLDPDTKPGQRQIAALPALVRSSGVPLDEFSTRKPEGLPGGEAEKFDRWSTARANESVDEVVRLHQDLGMGRWNASMRRYDARRGEAGLKTYLRSVTTAPPSILERVLRKHFWELKFSLWKLTGTLDPGRNSLSIGPRWVTEIEYFREVVGLRQHIGLDLFSDDPALVVAGDMHSMPFPNGHFHFIFLKNTADKSYNVRRLVEELLRVVEDRGLIVVDQICGYGRCSPLSRTDIQKASNLLMLFKARAHVEPLVCYDIDVSGIGDARDTNETRRNARLAIRVHAARR